MVRIVSLQNAAILLFCFSDVGTPPSGPSSSVLLEGILLSVQRRIGIGVANLGWIEAKRRGLLQDIGDLRGSVHGWHRGGVLPLDGFLRTRFWMPTTTLSLGHSSIFRCCDDFRISARSGAMCADRQRYASAKRSSQPSAAGVQGLLRGGRALLMRPSGDPARPATKTLAWPGRGRCRSASCSMLAVWSCRPRREPYRRGDSMWRLG